MVARRRVNAVLSGAIKLTVHFYLKTPKGFKNADKQLAEHGAIRPTKTPDIDNLMKAIQDALNGVAYVDDKQIVEEHSYKWYSEKPRVEIELEEF